MRTIHFVILSVSSCLLISCGELSPSCEAAQAKREVRRTIAAQLPSHIEFKLVGVNTLRTNFATGEVLCSAKIELRDAYASNDTSRSVGYMVQYDKQSRLKVTVF